MKLFFLDVFNHDKGKFSPVEDPKSWLADNWGLPMTLSTARTSIDLLELFVRKGGAEPRRVSSSCRNVPDTLILKGAGGEVAMKCHAHDIGPIDRNPESRYMIAVSGSNGAPFSASTQRRHLGQIFGKRYTKANAEKVLKNIHAGWVAKGYFSRLVESPQAGIVACSFKTDAMDFGQFVFTMHREDFLKKISPVLFNRQPDISIGKFKKGEKSFYLYGAKIIAGKREIILDPTEYLGQNWGKALTQPAAEIAFNHLKSFYSDFNRSVSTSPDRKEMTIQFQPGESLVLGYVKSSDYQKDMRPEISFQGASHE